MTVMKRNIYRLHTQCKSANSCPTETDTFRVSIVHNHHVQRLSNRFQKCHCELASSCILATESVYQLFVTAKQVSIKSLRRLDLTYIIMNAVDVFPCSHSYDHSSFKPYSWYVNFFYCFGVPRMYAPLY